MKLLDIIKGELQKIIINIDSGNSNLSEDELVEVTPVSYRMRKKILNTEMRKKQDSRK